MGGRPPREFAQAWATRRGFKDTEAVAEWAELVGPVGWDLYGAGHAAIPFIDVLLSGARQVSEKTPPQLGQGLWRYFPTTQHLAHDLEAAKKAVAIAERLQAPPLLAEARVIQGYATLVLDIYEIGSLVSRSKAPDASVLPLLQRAMDELAGAGSQVVTSIQDWAQTNGQTISTPRGVNTLRATEEAVAIVRKALAPFGIRDTLEQSPKPSDRDK